MKFRNDYTSAEVIDILKKYDDLNAMTSSTVLDWPASNWSNGRVAFLEPTGLVWEDNFTLVSDEELASLKWEPCYSGEFDVDGNPI